MATPAQLLEQRTTNIKGVFDSYAVSQCTNTAPPVPGTDVVHRYDNIAQNVCLEAVPIPVTAPQLGFLSFRYATDLAVPAGKTCKFDIFRSAGCVGDPRRTVTATKEGLATSCTNQEGRSIRFYCS